MVQKVLTSESKNIIDTIKFVKLFSKLYLGHSLFFLFCYEKNFMLSLSDNKQADVFEAANSTSRYLDGLFNFDNPYFEQMITQIYPTELQLN